MLMSDGPQRIRRAQPARWFRSGRARIALPALQAQLRRVLTSLRRVAEVRRNGTGGMHHGQGHFGFA